MYNTLIIVHQQS